MTLYWVTLILLRVILRGKRTKFSESRVFIFAAVLHNVLLSLASLLMNFQVTLAIIDEWRVSGFAGTVCTPTGKAMPQRIQFALYTFLVTKVWEYIDTVLLVLRGRSVSSLHLWHHSSVAWEVRGWLEYDMALGAYGMWFNTLVHVIMYAYYACAVLKVRFPFKKAITMLQIVQFITGFVFAVPYFVFNHNGAGCAGKPVLGISAAVNASFLILFIQFYRSTYKSKKS